jgi:hypothetical protein
MEGIGKLCTGAWGANLLAAAAVNLHALPHGLGVLLVFAATFFLFAAPVHLLLGLSSWAAYCCERARGEAAASRRAALRLFFAESALFWAAYWAMLAGALPLTIRG